MQPSAVSDQVEVSRREGGRPKRMDLPAGMQEQLDALGLDRGLQRACALGDRREVERIIRMADMRRDGGLVDAFAGEARRVDEARGLVGGTIVHPRQQVEMEINVGHRGLSGGSSVSARRIVLLFSTVAARPSPPAGRSRRVHDDAPQPVDGRVTSTGATTSRSVSWGPSAAIASSRKLVARCATCSTSQIVDVSGGESSPDIG